MNIMELEKLKKLLERKPTVFIGTGVSKAISGSKYADWAGWLHEGLRIIDRRVPEPESDEIKSLLEKNDSDSLIKAAEILKRKTTELNIYTDWMNDTIGSLRCVDKRLIYSIKDLMNLGCRVVTTNFDCLIEEALGFNSLLLSNKEDIVKFINGAINNAIVHFHGIYSRTKGEYEIVATHSEYLSITNDEGKQFFQKLLLSRPVLFIGCGNTQNDPNIGNILKFLTQMGFNDFHFLCKNANKNEGDFQTIIYGQEYEDLPGFLEQAIISFFDFGKCFRKVEVKPNNQNYSIHKYAYDSVYAPFVGRDKEFERLQQFMAHKTSTWWAITGKASTGKSRLAMEFMLSKQMSATICLYLNETNGAIPKIDEFMGKWSISILLIVIDYILGREEELGEFIIEISDKYNTGQVKLLLLEREPAHEDYGWFKNLSRNQRPQDVIARKLTNYLYQEKKGIDRGRAFDIKTLELRPLEDAYLEQIAEALNQNKQVTAKNIVEHLKKVDPELCRPLYLQMLADSIDSFDSPEEDSRKILKKLLETYYQRMKERALKSSKEPEQLIDNSIALIAFACAMNGLNLGELDSSPYLSKLVKSITDSIGSQCKMSIEKEEAVNGYLSFINELFQQTDLAFPALQPDIIAEFFVLNFVNDDQQIVDFSSACWRFDPGAYCVFLIRLCQDYGKTMGNLALKYLILPNDIMDTDRIGAWILISLLVTIYFENQNGEKLIDLVENKIEKLNGTQNYTIELQLAYAKGLVNMITAYGTAQEFGKASPLLDKLAAIQDASGEIKLAYANGLVNMINVYGTVQEFGKASELLDTLAAIQDASGEIKLAYANGLFNMINVYGTAQEFGKASALLDKIAAIQDESGEIKLAYAKGLVNMINVYGTAQEFGKASALLDKLAAIQDASGEIKLRYANGLVNMIYDYGTAQEFGKASVLLDKLAAIQDASGEIKLEYAKGLFNMITVYGTAQEFGKASELLDTLAAIQDASGEIKLEYAKGLVNMINAYERLGILDKKEDLLRKLELIREDIGKLLGII